MGAWWLKAVGEARRRSGLQAEHLGEVHGSSITSPSEEEDSKRGYSGAFWTATGARLTPIIIDPDETRKLPRALGPRGVGSPGLGPPGRLAPRARNTHPGALIFFVRIQASHQKVGSRTKTVAPDLLGAASRTVNKAPANPRAGWGNCEKAAARLRFSFTPTRPH